MLKSAFRFFQGLLVLLVLCPPLAGQEGEATYRFTYDAADNLLSRSVTRDGLVEEETMPIDGSGRNRPASVGGVAVEWDANGNLERKGDLYFSYDFRHRLTAVRDSQGEELARYVYDAFNRRVAQHVGADVIETVWNGLRPLETRVNGTLRTRRVYGLGLDEIVQVEYDGDGDGVLEQTYIPIYDSTGNLVVVTDAAGKPIERYAYTPNGHRKIHVDLTPPEVEQVRVVGGDLWIELSEVVNVETLSAALGSGALRLETSEETLALSLAGTVRHAWHHRLVVEPEAAPPPGSSVTLQIGESALVDLFHNHPAEAVVVDFSWPGQDAVVFDTRPPAVHEIAYREGVLEVEFTEEIDLATATASIQVSGNVTSWMPDESGYRLVAAGPIPDGTHDLYVTETLTDLAGTAIAETFYVQLHVNPSTPYWVAYRVADPREIAESTIANEFGFQGLPRDPVTGFLYVRNRYYDPDLGRFLTPDPLGYADSPNALQFAGNNPINFSDPLGLLLRVTGAERVPLENFYGEGNVSFEQVGSDLYEVSISEAGLAHLAEYVERTGGSERFAQHLNEAILTPFYQYDSLGSVYPRKGRWIGGKYEGKRWPGMPRGWAIDSPGSAMGSFGTEFGPVPMSPWEQTTPGMIHGMLDATLSPSNMLLIFSLLTPVPGDEEAVAGLAFGSASRGLSQSRGWVLPKTGGGVRIGSRWYTQHALERMAPRTPQVMAELERRALARASAAGLEPGTPEFAKWWARYRPDPRNIPPSVVEAEIATPGSTGVRVITNAQGDVVTVIPGGG